MKKLSALALCAMLAVPSWAETWTLDGKQFDVEVVNTNVMADGVTHKFLTLSSDDQKLEVHVVEVDMKSGKVDFYTNKSRSFDDVKKLKVSEDRLNATLLSEQLVQVKEAGQQPIVGVNGDFFSAYGTCGNQISNGTFVRCDPNTFPVWYMTEDYQFNMGDFPFKATATATYSACGNTVRTHSKVSINCYRDGDYLTIFTPDSGRSTGTNKWGSEVYAELIEGEVNMTGSCKFRIVEVPAASSQKNLSLDKYYVLSGNEAGSRFLTGRHPASGSSENEADGTPRPHLVAGDIVEFTFSTPIPHSNIKEMIGGKPEILRNGEVLETQGVLDHLVNNEPRTCIAYTNDNAKAFLAVVDGRRWGESDGCTSHQLACIMKNVGADNAFNLDGGGSTCMLDASTDKVMNIPTNGLASGVYDMQRAVQNSIWVVSKSNESSSINDLIVVEDSNAPVEYFNLQGVRVVNPQNGLYIRRQGSKTTKVIL